MDKKEIITFALFFAYGHAKEGELKGVDGVPSMEEIMEVLEEMYPDGPRPEEKED